MTALTHLQWDEPRQGYEMVPVSRQRPMATALDERFDAPLPNFPSAVLVQRHLRTFRWRGLAGRTQGITRFECAAGIPGGDAPEAGRPAAAPAAMPRPCMASLNGRVHVAFDHMHGLRLCDKPISWLNHTPTRVASWPALSSAHATLACGPSSHLTRAGVAPADRASFAWRLRINPG